MLLFITCYHIISWFTLHFDDLKQDPRLKTEISWGLLRSAGLIWRNWFWKRGFSSWGYPRNMEERFKMAEREEFGPEKEESVRGEMDD